MPPNDRGCQLVLQMKTPAGAGVLVRVKDLTTMPLFALRLDAV